MTTRPHLLGNKHRKGKIPWNKGLVGIQIPSIKTRKLFSMAKQKERNHNWKGGISPKYRIKTAPRKKPEQCEVCGSLGNICLDHDHKTNKFRGWICSRCNVALGMVKDNSELLIALANYIKTNGISGHNSNEESVQTEK